MKWKRYLWPTLEHAYQSERSDEPGFKEKIKNTRSAHDAFKLAMANKDKYKENWDNIKLDVMKDILRAKVAQHSYVKKKLLESGNKELIENSWRDDYWGWGENKDGENNLGKLWMEVREEIRKNKN